METKMKRTYLAFGAMVFAMGISQAGAESLLPAESIPGEFSASVAIGSDYVFRGVSQTVNDSPTVQGSLDYSIDSFVEGIGIYAGVWGSNVQFGTDDGSIELDWYGGLTGEASGIAPDPISWDIGFVYFHYPDSPDASNLDYWEGNISLGYDLGPYSLSAGLAMSPDFTGETGDSAYLNLGVEVPLKIPFAGLTAGGYWGTQWVDESDDYSDVKLALSADVLGFDAELAFHDTIGHEDGDTSDARVVIMVGRSF